ncbi:MULTISPECIES: protein-tyrosine phosphatase family protein [Roseovarius]|uniref:phosphatase domain-containing protein n=1 Tax=Roseovarius TaxID=74030 RepID=UPI001C96361E|nr:protein-tyrosine phosphatase family protein [Roseovarius atlanticus]MBY5986626.1 dual specificity protein phosphatase family protein [Roseovarius atlanticus]MBY6125266.1 dual specificity protein phosphatase family protein [Roseovarius atlanticus]MBY6150273.1 dual specificity protein phosphatase family protein [Roseovarius atlanticus]
MSDFVIYALPVAEGILGIAPMPGRGGHWQDDLQHLADWKPALVVSMTTVSEQVTHGLADMGAEIQDKGTRWIHLPVEDMGVPAQERIEEWHTASKTALAALQGGGRVLIHCFGGCGRSGMAALRLMVEAGEEAEAALARLRSVRPCAVETEEQLQWARAG